MAKRILPLLRDCGYRKCKKPFKPTRWFQLYCCPRHGVDENNAANYAIVKKARKEQRAALEAPTLSAERMVE